MCPGRAVDALPPWFMSFTLPVFLQSNLRMTAEQTGIVMLPGAIATALSMFIVGKLLYRLNNVYEHLTGQDSEVRVQLPWHRSMRGERAPQRRTTVLELVMMVSVALALFVFAVWFFFFAHASLPG